MEKVQQGPVSIEHIKTVYDNSNVHCAVVTDPQNNILYASQSLADALGYHLNELDNITFTIFPTPQTEPVLGNGINTFVQEPSKKGYVIQKDGSKALVDFESVTIQNGDNPACTLSRISNLEGYVQYNRLTDCQEILESILDNLTTSVVVMNPELFIIKNNGTFLKTFGIPAIAHANTALQELQCSFWQNENVFLRFKDNYHQELYNFDVELDWEKETGDAKSFKIISRLIHETEDSRYAKILLAITDITEEKANQTGRNQQIRHIMHELRNPLSNLSLCIELLADSVKENNQEDSAVFLAKAGNSIQRMKQLINDLNPAK